MTSLSVFILSLGVTVSACPPKHEVDMCDDCEIVELPVNCPSPFDGYVVTVESMDRMVKDLAYLDHRLRACRVTLDRTRVERTERVKVLSESLISCSRDAESLAESLSRIPEPPSRTVWLSAGVAIGAIASTIIILGAMP